jgi:hypothetical protein
VSNPRAIVAQFHKSAGGRLTLWSVVCIEEEKARDGGDDVWFSRKFYDVELSRKYGYLYHHSGSGGSGLVRVDGIYFATGDVSIKEEPCQLLERSKLTGRWKTKDIRARNKTRRLPALPKAFQNPDGDLMDWLERHAIEGDAVYCSECRDYFPEDSTCRHCWWCDKMCWWSTPSERCDHEGFNCFGEPHAAVSQPQRAETHD